MPAKFFELKQIRCFLFCVLFFTVIFPCAGVGGNDVPKDSKDPAYEEMKLLTDAIVLVKKEYVEDKSYADIIDGAINGMLQSLDPHSSFLDVDAYQSMQDDTTGMFDGIGIHVGIYEGAFTVIAPMEDSPAFKAGLAAGDVIVKIDGEEIYDKKMADIVQKLRGPKGEKVLITIMRPGESKNMDFEIVRDEIKMPCIKGTRVIKDGIGYIRITRFAGTTEEMLQKAIDDLMGQGMNALILDLRDNAGGLLNAAIGVAQKFLKKRQLVVTTKGRSGVHDKVESCAMGEYHYVDFPMAILVNGATASASEIVAGALQDHKRAVLVGTKTFGKGSVQSIIPLQSDMKKAIRLTTAYYYTPNGRQISGKGIEPDIEEAITPEEWHDMRVKRAREGNPEMKTVAPGRELKDVIDHQLNRAVDVLQGVKIFYGAPDKKP